MSSSRTEHSRRRDDAPDGRLGRRGHVVAWRVEVGDRIEADETICEISTDKIDTEVPAPVSGVVAEILVPVETTVDVGTVLARIAADGERGASTPADAARARGRRHAPAAATLQTPRRPRPRRRNGAGARRHRNGATPAPATAGATRRSSSGSPPSTAIDLAPVAGTGRGGRVRKQDVLGVRLDRAAARRARRCTSRARTGRSRAPDRAAPRPRPSRRDGGQLSRMRRQIGEHMKRSLETAATCTTWIEVDMSRVEAARARLGLTALPFVARATIDALREHPALNAWLEGERYTRHTTSTSASPSRSARTG